ncbi:hypothetical protein PIB30_082640 [Stylosanthes scabra]|uniref:Uncharacterized protein n=1 Tax=Stylosanthes scabra TaxID=79078 RepID=A0ABU6SUB6_9FABA|nr:hypothetical protein [Stylosanthes scabra]
MDGVSLGCGKCLSIYEKHRKSSRQGGSSGESRGVVQQCDGRILKNVVKELEELCSMWRLTLEGEIVDASPTVLLPTVAQQVISELWFGDVNSYGTCFKRHEVVIEKFGGRMVFGLWQVQVKDVLIQSGIHKMRKVWAYKEILSRWSKFGKRLRSRLRSLSG